QQAAGESAELDATRFNMDAARKRLGQLNALELPKAAPDPDQLFLAAHACAQEGDAARAITMYREALDRLRDAPPYEREAEARAEFATALEQAGQPPEAAAELRAAAKLFEARRNTPGLVSALCRVASPNLSPLPAAHASAERAVELAKTLGNPETLAHAFGALG